MTESAAPRPRKKQRLTPALLRGWAWILAGVSFFIPLSVLGSSPMPAGASDGSTPPPKDPEPRRVIHRVRRIIVVRHIPGPVTYIGGSSGGGSGYSGGSSSGGSYSYSGGSSSSSSGGSSGGGGGGGNPPPVSTGGS